MPTNNSNKNPLALCTRTDSLIKNILRLLSGNLGDIVDADLWTPNEELEHKRNHSNDQESPERRTVTASTNLRDCQ